MYRWAKWVIVALAVIAGATYLWWQMAEDQSTLRLNGVLYHISIMRTNAQLQKGLSGTDSLPQGDAMLFVFPRDDKWPMWMKDMKYPIDMVWLNDGGQVIYTVKNATPASYPKKFQPITPARYVIEFPAGTIVKTRIENGEAAGLPSGA